MSHFAAGCAICGADLEAYRRQLAERRASGPRAAVAARMPAWARRRPGALDRLSPAGDVHPMRLALAIALTLFAPFVGIFLAAWFAYEADRDGRTWVRNALIAVCGFAFAMLYLAPFSFWGLLL